MNDLLHIAHAHTDIDSERLDRLRRALLLSDRVESRLKGQRKLKALSLCGDPYLSPLAMAGLAASYMWAGEFHEAILQCQSVANTFPYSSVSIWCSKLLIEMYRSLGMSHEAFEAQSDRMRLMKKIVLQGEHSVDRIYALHELKKELEGWGRREESEHFTRELRTLVLTESHKLETNSGFNEDLN